VTLRAETLPEVSDHQPGRWRRKAADRERFRPSTLVWVLPASAWLIRLFFVPTAYAVYIGFTNMQLLGPNAETLTAHHDTVTMDSSATGPDLLRRPSKPQILLEFQESAGQRVGGCGRKGLLRVGSLG
jgi:ABC-type sugar transport system permease subunit